MASRDFGELTRNEPRPLIGRSAAWRCALEELRFWLSTLKTVNRRCGRPVGADCPSSRPPLRAADVTSDAQAWKQS